MGESDRVFYIAWGVAIVLIGIASALALVGMWGLAMLVLFGGVGAVLIALNSGDSMKFYGGIAFLVVGILLFAVLSGFNIAYSLIILVIIVGALVMWYGLSKSRGDRK